MKNKWKISMKSRKDIIRSERKDYKNLCKKDKGIAINKVSSITGLSREYVKKRLNYIKSTNTKNKIVKPKKYNYEFVQLLIHIWKNTGQMCGGSIYIYK